MINKINDFKVKNIIKLSNQKDDEIHVKRVKLL